jgi:hypothetical protein
MHWSFKTVKIHTSQDARRKLATEAKQMMIKFETNKAIAATEIL